MTFLNWRTVVAALHDVVASALAWLLAYELRFNFDVAPFYAEAMFADLAWIVPLQALVSWRSGLYRGLWRYASLTDLRRILMAAAFGALSIAMVVVLQRLSYVPRSVIVLYPILLAAVMAASRAARAWKEGRLAPRRRGTARGGAGAGARRRFP